MLISAGVLVLAIGQGALFSGTAAGREGAFRLWPLPSSGSWLHGLVLAAAFLGSSPESGCAQEPGPVARTRIRDLAGARDRPGLFTQRLVMPASFCSPVHTHDQDLHGLVLRGILLMGFPDSLGRLEIRKFPPGSFVPVPAGQPHVEGSSVETEIHLSGVGPLRTTLVDSSTPSRCTARTGESRPGARAGPS